MGVRNLWDILESCKQTLPLHHLQNKRICVDLSCWIVQLHTACRSPACLREKVYLRNLFHRLRALIALNCSLIFVTDGSIPAIKLSTYKRRLRTTSEISREEKNSNEISSVKRNMGSLFSCMIKEAKLLGLALGIPCLDGLEEAEAQCALLDLEDICDGCFSGDSDIFLFGARTVYRDIVLGDGGHVTCYKMVDIERNLGYGRNSLIALGLLLGSDYSQGLRGFGPVSSSDHMDIWKNLASLENACQTVKSLGEARILQQIMSAGFKFEKKNHSKRKGKTIHSNENKQDFLDFPKLNSEYTDVQETCGEPVINSEVFASTEDGHDPATNSQFREVIEAYLKPKCHLADSEAIARVCAQYLFLRDQLQKLCAQFFCWEPEKTDQYILPKIAERDLRRFANLRATSSRVGIQTSLEMMPVPCPVSAIVKQRKVNGDEYFEVSWHGIDGLETSSVPARLIQCACPEKITKFVEEITQKKEGKRKTRQRKSDKVAVRQVDVQLQSLTLSTEAESDKPNLDVCSHSSLTDGAQVDVIDLLSPSPNIRAHKFAKHHQNTNNYTNPVTLDMDGEEDDLTEIGKEDLQNFSEVNKKNAQADDVYEAAVSIGDSTVPAIDVINIDSDIDESPEHQRKARDLRIFLDSIKGDLY